MPWEMTRAEAKPGRQRRSAQHAMPEWAGGVAPGGSNMGFSLSFKPRQKESRRNLALRIISEARDDR